MCFDCKFYDHEFPAESKSLGKWHDKTPNEVRETYRSRHTAPLIEPWHRCVLRTVLA
jgi:hypothetical protein